jgi:hypothetical protein
VLNETGVAILREVAETCDRADIEVLPVKGIITSHLFYNDVSERPLTDVDVRIRARDFDRFKRAATAAGWECSRVARSYRNLTYDFGSMTLDVEACIGPPGLCALETDAMIERSLYQEIVPGLRVSVPDIHDHAIVLTVNVFKDKIATTTPWALEDLERVVLQPNFRRDRFLDRIHESRISTLSWIVARWLGSVRKNLAWAAIGTSIESQLPLRRPYAWLMEHQLKRAERAPLSLRLLARVAADSRRMQLEALMRAGAWVGEMWLRGEDVRTL